MFSFDQLCSIATCGGGFEVDANRFSFDQLCSIATCGSRNGARISINLQHKKLSFDQICSISTCGKGCVSFTHL